jgi:plasmid stabilization system protein ParE
VIDYVIAEAARDDLAGIDDYTALMWGDGQARRYIAALWAADDRLAAAPRLGRSHRNFPGIRLHKVGRHFIVYCLGEGERVEVLNVLHEAMDITPRLAAPP